MIRSFLVFIIVFTAAAFSIQGQNMQSEEVAGKYKTTGNDMVTMYGKVYLGHEEILYQLPTGRKRTEKQKNIKWLFVYNSVYMSLPTKKEGGNIQLMKILAITKDRLLAQYWNHYQYCYNYYIYDHHGNILMGKLAAQNRSLNKGAEKNNWDALEVIKKWIDCPALIEAMTSNFTAKEDMSSGVDAIQCEGSPKLETIISSFENKSWYTK